MILGGMFVGAIGIAGFRLQINTYQRDSAERSFSQFVTDLSSTSTNVQRGALARFPEIMTREVPKLPSKSLIPQLQECLLLESKEEQRFAIDTQLHIKSYLSAQNRDISTKIAPVGKSELDVLFKGLARVGYSGWYGGADSGQPKVEQKGVESLRRSVEWDWIWRTPREHSKSINASLLFSNSSLKGLDLKHLLISKAIFSEATISQSEFSYSSLRSAKFDKTVITKCDFDSVDAREIDFSGAVIDDVKFSRSVLIGANFGDAKMKAVSLIDSEITNASFVRTDAKFSQWANARCGEYMRVVALTTDLVQCPVELLLRKTSLRCKTDTGEVWELRNTTSTAATVVNKRLTSGLAYWISSNLDAHAIDASDRTRFYDSDFGDSDFSSVQLLATDIDECNFRNCVFRNATIAHSRIKRSSFSSADIENLVIEDCDIEDCDFGSVQAKRVRSCAKSRFIRCIGISDDLKKILLDAGAEFFGM